ncbi:MAG: chemotaxis protein CheC [Oscillospiraceae bacterium]|jgi:chemotaxis protein CheC|nr:chemotaxis protein CheC [Oscillospiraceae bacterium]
MALTNFEGLNPMHFDVLTEIGNIGSGNAAAALSDMTQQHIKIRVPEVSVLKFNEVMQFFGSAEKVAAGLLVNLTQDMDGMILYLFGDDFVNETLKAFFGESTSDLLMLDDMQKSALLEIGNIMAASYVNALSQMTSFFIDISVPSLAVDMAGALLSVPIIEFANISESVLLINDSFIINNKEVDSHMILLPTVESLNKLFTNLGVEI